MNSTFGVSGVAAAAPVSLNEQALNLIQAQMLRYVNDSGAPPGSVDFKALQNAINSGNIIGAQAALARLHRDNQAVSTSPQPPTQAAAPTTPASANSTSDESIQSGSIDVTA